MTASRSPCAHVRSLASAAVVLSVAPRISALTPVQAFGSEFALLVPDTRIQEL